MKRQVAEIQDELNWKGDAVENVPTEFNYEKIECWMQGVRDYIKYIKRGYTRPTHLAAIEFPYFTFLITRCCDFFVKLGQFES